MTTTEPLILGRNLEPTVLLVSAHSTYELEATNEVGDWAPGQRLEIRLSTGAVWTATMTGPTARWDVSATEVDALIDELPGARASLWFVNESDQPVQLTRYGPVRVES